MYTLCIEHPVPSYENWKQAFDSDPVGRERMKVRRYQILRPVDNPNTVMINLEFDTEADAHALLTAMREVWKRVEGTIVTSPRAQIVQVMETKSY